MSRNSRTWMVVLAIVVAAGIAGYFFSGSRDEKREELVERGEAGDISPEADRQDEKKETADSASSDRKSAAGESRDTRARFPEMEAGDVPESVEMIVGVAEEKGYKARMDAVHDLGRNLSRTEVDALMGFLGTRYDNLSSRQFNSVKNDVVEKLLRQETMPADLGTRLAEMYAQEDRDPVWRDYCIQLVSLYYGRRWQPGSEVKDEERERIRQTLWDAVDADMDSGISGTALLSLKRLSEEHPEFGKDRLREVCVRVLSNGESHPSARTCALQTASSLGDRRVLPAARRTAESADRIPLRMAAIAALGRLGDETDIELLERVVVGDAGRYTCSAAETAIERIRSRSSTD